jgi:hypothetical protein
MFFALVSIEIYYDKRFGVWDTLLQPKPLHERNKSSEVLLKENNIDDFSSFSLTLW